MSQVNQQRVTSQNSTALHAQVESAVKLMTDLLRQMTQESARLAKVRTMLVQDIGEAPPVPSGDFAGLTIVEASKQYLRTHPRAKTVELVRAFEEGGLGLRSVHPANTVHATLSGARRRGIKRVAPGTWALERGAMDRGAGRGRERKAA